MRHLGKAAIEISAGGGVAHPHWSDDESELPPAKRPRDNGYSSDQTAITEYDDIWSHQLTDNKNAILTPPSMVRILYYFFSISKTFY